jgi:hypothetical protein
MLLHIETHHSEGQSPFVTDEQTVTCPHTDCGERVAEDELDHHVRMHGLESSKEAPTASDVVQPLETKTTGKAVSDTSRRSSKDTTRSSKTSSRTHPPKSPVAHAWRMLFAKSKANSKDEQRTRRHRKDQESGKTSREAVQESEKHKDASTKSSSRRGKSELGRFANEKEMPPWLVSILQRDSCASTAGEHISSAFPLGEG